MALTIEQARRITWDSCAYCSYPLFLPHVGGTTGLEQCDVCGADVESIADWDLKTDEERSAVIEMMDRLAVAAGGLPSVRVRC